MASSPQPTGVLHGLRIDVATIRRDRGRPLARLCRNRSARCHPLAGALTTCMPDLGWMQRRDDSRALTVTHSGRNELDHHFGIRQDHLPGLSD